MTDYVLNRRGFDLGSITNEQARELHNVQSNWQRGLPSLIVQGCVPELSAHGQDFAQSDSLYRAILLGAECDPLLDQAPYQARLADHFESLGSSVSEGDEQEIETIFFDALANGELIAEDLWMKISWLSFFKDDASLRFRFSFGVDFEEDVAADAQRQHYAALLSDAIFPESRLITDNLSLLETIKTAAGADAIKFVERIVYFNSPGGGAYLHHDRERGHAGVVYAQLTGTTHWLALPRNLLCDEIVNFVLEAQATEKWPASINPQMQNELIGFAADTNELAKQLETFANSTLIHLINETEAFVQRLIANGHGHLVNTGDVILLPQEGESNCCWHSVFCIGETSGQSLSFAIRCD